MKNSYAVLNQQTQYITELEQDNLALAKIVHRDNKLIPAMEAAVMDCLNSNTPDSNQKKYIIIEQLRSVFHERQGILKSYQHIHKELPSTAIPLLDTILTYMLKKASNQNIDLDADFPANASFLIENIIPVNTLQTLIADLIENALYAVSNAPCRKVLISIEMINDFYILNVFDSGNLFDLDVLLSLGVSPRTSHPEDGGSGIGIMSIFDMMQSTESSLVITEYPEPLSAFTKCISICFDYKKEFRINSFRSHLLTDKCERKDIQISPHHITTSIFPAQK